MAAGRLRQVIEIQSKSSVHQGGGVYAPGWANAFAGDIRAEIEPQSGRSVMRADQRVDNHRYLVRIYRRDGIDNTMRVIWKNEGSRVLKIESVGQSPKHKRMMDMVCYEEEPAT
jgi:SPP1 family predicted phage head-tail adaptor